MTDFLLVLKAIADLLNLFLKLSVFISHPYNFFRAITIKILFLIIFPQVHLFIA